MTKSTLMKKRKNELLSLAQEMNLTINKASSKEEIVSQILTIKKKKNPSTERTSSPSLSSSSAVKTRSSAAASKKKETNALPSSIPGESQVVFSPAGRGQARKEPEIPVRPSYELPQEYFFF